ncbi:MAG TPA: hypothetical protein VFX59_28350 [Polyangiales bacterium]|nr:hypothetical protein [Polyangiales bacterium]
MSQKLFRTLASFALITTLGCEDDDRVAEARYTARALEDGLLFTPADGEAEHHALLLDVSGADPKTTQLALPGGAVTTFARPSKNGQVVVLTSGLEAVRSGKDKRAAVPSSVLIYGKAGEVARRTLQGRYQNLSLSPDGRYGIAFGSQAGLSVDNSAEVIDFDSEAAPTFVDLSLDARAPSRFVFSPVGSFTHRVAVAPQPNALQVIDLDAPGKGPISITLTVSSALTPEQIVFAGDRMFVRSASSEQIVILQAIEVPRGDHSWQPAPQQQFASGIVQDIAVTGVGAAQRLLALTSALEVFDPAIGPTARIEGVSGFNRILQFTGRSPIDANRTSRAMLYATQPRSSSQVGFVDLGDETAWTTRNIELVELGDAIQSLTPLLERNVAVTRHTSERAGVIDLEARTVRRLVLNEYAGTLLVDEDGPAEPQLWALGTSGELGRVNLASFARIELPFSLGSTFPFETASELLLVPSATRRRLAVLQPADTGRVTFVDADAPSSEAAADSALEVLGIYLPELLD